MVAGVDDLISVHLPVARLHGALGHHRGLQDASENNSVENKNTDYGRIIFNLIFNLNLT